jgi:hypothetical protein
MTRVRANDHNHLVTTRVRAPDGLDLPDTSHEPDEPNEIQNQYAQHTDSRVPSAVANRITSHLSQQARGVDTSVQLRSFCPKNKKKKAQAA